MPPAAPVKSLELFTANTQACFGAVYEHCLAPVGTAVHRGVQVLSCPHMSTACMHRIAASHAAHRGVQAVTRVAWDGLKTGCSGLSSGLASADGLLTEGLYFTADTIAAWARTSWRLVVKAYTAIESCLGGVCAALGRVLRSCGSCLERYVLQPMGACCATLGRAVSAIGSAVGRAVGAGRSEPDGPEP